MPPKVVDKQVTRACEDSVGKEAKNLWTNLNVCSAFWSQIVYILPKTLYLHV